MGGSRIFDWGGPRIDKARDDRQNVALYALKSWPIWGGPWPCAPPPWNRPCALVTLRWLALKYAFVCKILA